MKTEEELKNDIETDGNIERSTRDTLKEKRSNGNIKTFDDLIDYLRDVKTNESYQSYGGVVAAMGQAALAVSHYFSREFGITGFQAGAVMWEFVQGWNYTDNKCGLRILNYDDLMYPQYDYKFYPFTITPECHEVLKKEAKAKLEKEDKAHPDVKRRWEDLADGFLPSFVVVKGEFE